MTSTDHRLSNCPGQPHQLVTHGSDISRRYVGASDLIHPRPRGYFLTLLILSLLFLLRVAAQAQQKWAPVASLPAFDRWYSGTLAYDWLLCAQVAILALMALVLTGFRTNRVMPNRRTGRWLLAFGAVYFLSMLLRLVIGLTIAQHHPWLGKTIPALFHLDLALFLIVLGRFHIANTDSGEGQ